MLETIQESTAKSSGLERTSRLGDRETAYLNPGLIHGLRKSLPYALELIDDEFLKDRFSRDSVAFLESLVSVITFSSKDSKELRKEKQKNILIKKNIISKNDMEMHVLAPHDVNVDRLIEFLLPDEHLKKTLPLLVKKGILTSQTIWNYFLTKKQTFFNQALKNRDFDWKSLIASGVLKPDQINRVTGGFDAVEFETLQKDLLGQSRKSGYYPHAKDAHPLVQKLRGQEHIRELSTQIAEVTGEDSTAPVMEEFERVFDTYLRKTPLYKELSKRDALPSEEREKERAENIRHVNDLQTEKLKRAYHNGSSYFDPEKRFLDIYARYGHHGFMDPLQLAIIARTINWYVMGDRSRLFSDVRVIPYMFRKGEHETIPYIALAACPGAKLLTVRGDSFHSSIHGANRIFLTHSIARDASNMHSIPIIGLATYKNRQKIPANRDEYAVLHADFDPRDPYRSDDSRDRVEPDLKLNTSGDIQKLINETLRALMEAEEKEINRAVPKRPRKIKKFFEKLLAL